MATEGEQNVYIKVEIDDAEATVKLTKLDGSIETIKLGAESAAGGFTRFEAATVALSSAVSLAQVAFTAVTGAAAALFSAIERGSQIDDVSSAFENLTAKAGGVADVFLKDLKDATGQTISSFELMEKANRSLQSGIKPDQYLELAKAARVLAEETGGNLVDELANLERAFATGQDQILKNRLGVLDLAKAQEALAKELGITASELSEEQKIFASRNAIVEAARKKTAEFGKVENDAGDAIAQVVTALKDKRDELLKAMGSSDRLKGSIEQLAKAIRSVDVKPIIRGLEYFTEYLVNETIPNVGRGIDVILEFFGKQTEQDSFVNEAIRQFEALERSVANSKTKARLDEIRGSAENVFDVLAHKGATVTPEVTAAFESLNRELQVQFREIEKGLSEIFDGASDKVSGGSSPLKGLTKEVNEVKETIEEEEPFDFEEAVFNGFENALRALGSSIGSGDFKGAIGGVGNALSQAFGQILSQADLNGSLLGTLVNSLGSAAGPVGAIIGGVAGPFISSIVDSILTDIESGDYLGAFSTSLDTIFPGVGSFAEKIVGSLFGGGDSAGTEAKKSADKFFADLLDANRVSVVISGQLQQISDLVFSGNQGGVGLFAGLEPAAQAAFRGVGSAFESLLGIAQNLGVDIGNVFANNLGGSLNNLQILVQQLGFSFDQLKSGVVKAFLDGKLSATQAAEALRGIEQISQKGIPDALGAVDQAFQNLIDSGTSGGAALVDALGDIASEAKELSFTSFQEVRDFLTNSGKFTEEQISQLFSTLASNGIDSIDELENVTAEQTINIVEALGAAGLAFSNVGSEVTNIAAELNNIPSEIRTTVRVRYIAEGDATAAASVGQSIGTKDSSFLPGGEGISTSSSAFSGSASRRPGGLTGR